MWRYDWAWGLLCLCLVMYQLRGNRRLVMDADEVAVAGRRRMRLARAVLPAGAAWAGVNALVRLGVRLDFRRDLLADELLWAVLQVLVVCSVGLVTSRTGRPRWMIHPALRDL